MLDWDDLRYFLAVARHGSLSAAARALGVAQPTVGRRLDGLERRLGARLLRRTPAGFSLTAAGRSIVGHVGDMEDGAHAAERLAAGRDTGLEGSVRLTSTEWFGRQVLAPLLARFCAQHAGITVELLADVRLYSLAGHEADVAVRLGVFPQQEVVRRKLGRVAFGLYASPQYLARHGEPDFTAGCPGHALVTMNDNQSNPFPDSAWLGELAHRARVGCRTTSRDQQAALATAGAGLTTLPRFLGDSVPGLRALAPPSPIPSREVWLGVHRDSRETPRIRALVAFLGREVPRLRAALDP